MALSGFIKSLLQTDTVFGSEAKKVTGINDSIIQLFFEKVTAQFLIDNNANTFTLVLDNYDTSRGLPQWFVAGKYIKFFFFNIDNTQTGFSDLNAYENKLFQIQNITEDVAASTLTVTFNPDANGTPNFNTDTLPNIPSISNFDLKFDGRIFSLIGDPDIAREASNGSTMFNLDNENISSFAEADSSGIARKFGSHYHTDLVSEIVVHDKDPAGFDLIRIGIRNPALIRSIIYDEEEALVQATMNPPVITPANTFIEFTSGSITQKVAEYGVAAKRLKGTLFRLTYSTDHNTVPRGTATDTTFNRDVNTHDGFTFLDTSWYVNIPQAIHTPTQRNWLVFNNFQFSAKLEQEKAATEIVNDLNGIYGHLYTFSVGTIGPTEIPILYEAVTAGLDTSEVTLHNRSNPASNAVLFHDTSDVTPGTAAEDPTKDPNGLQFLTVSQLISRLRENNSKFNLNFTIGNEGDVLEIGTDTDGSKSFTITVPTTDPPVFYNLVESEGLTDLTVNNGLFRILKSQPDVVFDQEGNAVFSSPFFGRGS